MSFLTDFSFLWRTRTSSWMLWNMLPTCLGSCGLLCYLQRAIMSSVSFQEETNSWNVEFGMGHSSAFFGTMVSCVRYLLALFSSVFSYVHILQENIHFSHCVHFFYMVVASLYCLSYLPLGNFRSLVLKIISSVKQLFYSQFYSRF